MVFARNCSLLFALCLVLNAPLSAPAYAAQTGAKPVNSVKHQSRNPRKYTSISQHIDPARDGAPDPTGMYEIKIECSGKYDLPSGVATASWLPKQKTAFAHFVVVTTAQNSSIYDPSKITGATAVAFAYSVDQSAGSSFDNRNNGSCNKELLVSNPLPTYFVAVTSYTRSYSAGQIGNFFNSLGSGYSLAATGFGLSSLDKRASGALTGAESSPNPVTAIMGFFHPAVADSIQEQQPLNLGTTKITTSFSTINIHYTAMPPILDEDSIIRANFRSLVPPLDPKTSLTDDSAIGNACHALRNKLYGAGIRRPSDQIYALLHSAEPVLISSAQMKLCLGSDLTTSALGLSAAQKAVLWEGIPDDLKFASGTN